MIHINKKKIIIVIIVILFGFGLFFIADRLNNGKLSSKLFIKEKITPIPMPSLTNDQITDKVIIWLNSMKNPTDNLYFNALECSNKGDCQLTSLDKQVVTTVLWSQYKHYKKSGSGTEFSQIKQDIVQYSKRSEIENDSLRIYQLDFWHCRLLYEMAKDSVFDDEYKNQLKNICQNNNYFLARTDLINIINANNLDKIFPKDQERYAINNTIISDFVNMYYWFADDQLLKIANRYFVNAKNYYLKNKLFPADSAYLTIASLDLYLATRNRSYLDFANDLYSQFAATERNALNINQLTELCLTSQMYYNSISKDLKYLNAKNTSLSTIIKKGFDNDKGAFHSFDLNGYVYETRNNALLVGCLID